MSAKILLVDDHAIVLKGIRQLLEGYSCWQICGEANNGRDAIKKYQELQPDLVLMDVSMPQMNGIEALKEIRRLNHDAKVVLLSMHDSPQIAQQTLALGAKGYVVKSSSPAHLRETIANALAT